MKLYHNKYYIKLIPGKYFELKNIADYLEDEHQKRLSKQEIKNITAALFQQRVMQVLISELKKTDPLVFEQIQGTQLVAAYKVTTNDNQIYFVVEFDNRCKVRCSEAIYKSSPIRGRLNYASCLSTNRIPPPAREQLRLFPEIL